MKYGERVGAGVDAGADAGLHYARVRCGITGEGREVAPRVGGITGKGASAHYAKDENSHA